MTKKKSRKKNLKTQRKPVYSKGSSVITKGTGVIPNLFRNLHALLLFLFIFLLPTQLGKHFFFDFSYLSAVRIDYLAPALYLIDIIAVILIVLYFKKIILIFRNKYFLIFLGFLVFNTLTSLSHPLAIFKCLKILEVIFIAVIFYKHKLFAKWLLIAFLSSSVVQLVLVSLQLIYKQSLQGIFYFLGERLFNLSTPGIAKVSYQGIELLRPYGTFSHPNSMAGFYLLLHAFVLTYKPFDKYPVLKYSLLGISALLILISFSKIAIIGFFLLTFFYTMTHEKETKCKFCMASRVIVAGILAVIFTMAHGDPMSGITRLELAKNSLEIIKSHLITGVGLGNYLIAQNSFSIMLPYFFLQPVHNILLLFIAEVGIIFSGYIAYLLWRFRKIFIDNETLLYAVGVIIFTGIFDHYWLTLQQNTILAAFIVSLSIPPNSSSRG